MGQQFLREMKDNGERCTDLCATSSLIIGGSLLQHQRIHKATWVSPDLQTENQIDYMCIGKRFQRTLRDVCVRLRCGIRPPSAGCMIEAQPEEKLDKEKKLTLGYDTFVLIDTNKQGE